MHEHITQKLPRICLIIYSAIPILLYIFDLIDLNLFIPVFWGFFFCTVPFYSDAKFPVRANIPGQ